MTPDQTRCGFAALIGAPNAGKSTLINALVGSKVSIVSRKVQTTRVPVRGIALEGLAQIIFVDTPGIFAPKRRLDRAMVAAAWSGAGDADVVALLVDARKGLDAETEVILDKLGEGGKTRFLLLNKIDTVEVEALLGLAETVNARLRFDETFMISALRAHGSTNFATGSDRRCRPAPGYTRRIRSPMRPCGPSRPRSRGKKCSSGCTRSCPIRRPSRRMTGRPCRTLSRVEQTIFVTRPGHKKIVIGEDGRTIKSIGKAARKDIGEAADATVHLFLHVKVRENWLDDPERFREMGLDFPKGQG